MAENNERVEDSHQKGAQQFHLEQIGDVTFEIRIALGNNNMHSSNG